MEERVSIKEGDTIRFGSEVTYELGYIVNKKANIAKPRSIESHSIEPHSDESAIGYIESQYQVPSSVQKGYSPVSLTAMGGNNPDLQSPNSMQRSLSYDHASSSHRQSLPQSQDISRKKRRRSPAKRKARIALPSPIYSEPTRLLCAATHLNPWMYDNFKIYDKKHKFKSRLPEYYIDLEKIRSEAEKGRVRERIRRIIHLAIVVIAVVISYILNFRLFSTVCWLPGCLHG